MHEISLPCTRCKCVTFLRNLKTSKATKRYQYNGSEAVRYKQLDKTGNNVIISSSKQDLKAIAKGVATKVPWCLEVKYKSNNKTHFEKFTWFSVNLKSEGA